MFGWFRKYIRKIGIFGVEVEFHPPTDTATDKPAPAPVNQDIPKRATVEKPVRLPRIHLENPPTAAGAKENDMALRKCPEPECGKPVSTMAETCPHCGCPLGAMIVPDPVTEDGPEPDPIAEMEPARRAYLVGTEPKGKKVYLLVKVHDYRGKAIYKYNLLTGVLTQEANSSTPDIDARIARYRKIGHMISHPGTIPYTKAREWCDHARAEALRLELVVGM